MDAVLQRRSVLDQVESPAGQLAFLARLGAGQPDRRHEVSAGELGQDPGVDAICFAGQRGETLDLLRVRQLNRPAVQLQGVVDKARSVHRLDDREHLLVSMVTSHGAHQAPQAVAVGRSGPLLYRRALLVQ